MKEQKRNILRAASKLFHKRGYKATTLQEIASQLSMEAPSLYNHISSKQAILSELLLHVATRFTEGIDYIEATDLPPIEKLKRVIRLHVELSYQFPDTMSIMRSEYVHLGKDDLKRYIEKRDHYDSTFRSILTACSKVGVLKSDNIDLVLFSLSSTLRSLYAWINKYQSYNSLELEEEVIDLLLNGVMDESS